MNKKCLAILFLPLFLWGCSSTFAYNNLDWLLYWYMDDYVDLERDQKKMFDGHLENWLDWHRSEELVEYRNHLMTLREELEQGDLTKEQWVGHFERGRGHWERFRNHIVPTLVDMSPRLTDEQVTDLFAKLAKDIKEDEEEVSELDESEIMQERKEDLEKQLSRYVGKINESQKQLIAEYAPQFQSTFAQRQIYLKEVQARAKMLLEQRQIDPSSTTALEALMLNPDQYKSEQYVQTSAHNRALFAQLLEDVQPTLTQRQRNHVFDEIDDFIDMLDDLIED